MENKTLKLEWNLLNVPEPEAKSIKEFKKSIKLVGKRSVDLDLITVFMHRDVFGIAATLTGENDECGLGLFYGKAYFDSNDMKYFVDVSDFRRIPNTIFDDGCVASLESMMHFTIQGDKEPIQGQLVGMLRGVPGAGLILKEDIQNYYQLWLPYPFQFLLLVDPMDDEMGLVTAASHDSISSINIYINRDEKIIEEDEEENDFGVEL